MDQSLAHADNLLHGYSLLKFHSDVIHNGISPLWTNLVYGGHPLFAESQAGLANPINYLVAWLLPAEFGHNLLHFLSMVAFACGCYGLCRCLSITPIGSAFACFAATFSSLVIHNNTNMTATEAMVWIPWTFWACEAWLKKPGPVRAALLGLSTAMLVVSGYPQFLHGVVIYMLVSMWPLANRHIPQLLRLYLPSGLFAVALCIGLTAFQWMPLLELAAQSHRSEGIEVVEISATKFQLKGLLYSNVTRHINNSIPYFPNVGSLLVCVLASASLLLPSSPRIKGHIVATLLLLNLGIGSDSPVYRLFSDSQLIPGLSNFRILFPYYFMSIIGIAVLAGHSLDRLSSSIGRPGFELWRALSWIALATFWIYVLISLRSEHAPLMNYLVVVAFGVAAIALVVSRRIAYITVTAVALLLVEIATLKSGVFQTVDNQMLLRPPESANYILSRPGVGDFKHYQLGVNVMSWTSAYDKNLPEDVKSNLLRIPASTNLLWGIPSFSGALALKGHSKPAANEIVHSDIEGHNDSSPGNRLMDVMSIKWLSPFRGKPSEHLVRINRADGKHLLWKNPHARPLIQTYQRVTLVGSAEEALAEFSRPRENTLVLQASEGEAADLPLNIPDGRVRISSTGRSATRYRLYADSENGFWLFLADNPYPGWQAELDGEEVKIWTAQVLGKAVYVPPGSHKVKIFFEATSARRGIIISLLSVLLLPLVVAALRKRNAWANLSV